MKMEIRIHKVVLCICMLFTVVMFTSVIARAETTTQIQKSYNISSDKKNPVTIPLNQTTYGPLSVYEQWYTFSLTEASTVTGIYASERGWLELYDSNDNRKEKVNNDKDFSWALEAGSYTIKVIAGGSSSIYVGKEYALTLHMTPYDWGTLKIDWNTTNLKAPCYVPFRITVEGSPNTRVFMAGDGRISYGAAVGNGWEGTLSPSTGYNVLEVHRYADGYGFKIDTFEYAVKPDTDNFTSAMFKVGTTYAEIEAAGEIQMKQGNKWVTVTSSPVPGKVDVQRVNGLKPDTAYTFRAVKYIAAEGKPTIYGEPTTSATIVTASKKKVAIKSIKATGFKTKYVKREYVGGHYNIYNRWIGGHYEGGYHYTTYKLKVTLKKKVPGLKTKYLYINGQKCKVKGKSYTITQGYKGKRSRKKIKVTIYTAKDEIYQGYGPSVKKKITIR